MRREAELWLRDAVETLEDARITLRARRFHVAVERSILAVEKAFKGAILAKGKAAPKTHNLVELYRVVKRLWPLPRYDEEHLAHMTTHYLPSRYFNASNVLPAQAYGPKLAREFYETASRIVNEVNRVVRR